MDDKLTTKTVKFTSLKNLYIYGITISHGQLLGIICMCNHVGVQYMENTYAYS